MAAVSSIIVNQFGIDTMVRQGHEFGVLFLDPRRRPQKHLCKRIDLLPSCVRIRTNHATLHYPLTFVRAAEKAAA